MDIGFFFFPALGSCSLERSVTDVVVLRVLPCNYDTHEFTETRTRRGENMREADGEISPH